MGLSIAQAAVSSLISQLNGVEAEALSCMGALTSLNSQKTSLNNTLLDLKSDTAIQPSKSDYTYTVTTGQYGGQTFQIDSRDQDFSPITTDTGAYVTFKTTQQASGNTLQSGDPLPMSYDGKFRGSKVSRNQVSYSNPQENQNPTGYVVSVKVINPAEYYDKTKLKQVDNTSIDSDPEKYEVADENTPKENLVDANGNPVSFSSNEFTVQELNAMGASVVKDCSGSYRPDGGFPNGITATAGDIKVYIPGDTGKSMCGAVGIVQDNTGESQINKCNLSNLYVLNSGSRQCRHATEKDLEDPNAVFVVKNADATSLDGSEYTDIKVQNSTLTIGGNTPMTFSAADCSNEDIPIQDLIDAAMHYCANNRDKDGNPICDEEYVRNNFQIVKNGDCWGLVKNGDIEAAKNRTGSQVHVYSVTKGTYNVPGEDITAHNLQFNADGELTGFTVGDQYVELSSKTVYDEMAYEEAMKEYRYKCKAAEVEQNTVQKELNELAQEGSDLEARLNELSNLKTVLEGFLEAAKSLAKSDAERLGKAFSG